MNTHYGFLSTRLHHLNLEKFIERTALKVTYVISKDGQPLMPTSRCGKVYRLLKNKKAKVISRCPFIIKLLYESTNFTQDLTLGVDTGSSTLATAVSDSNGDIFYTSEV